MPRIPVYQVRVPEYTVRGPPDCAAIGRKIDGALKRHFMDRKVAIRCISARDHRGKSVDDLVRIIRRIGTDRYAARRKGDRYDNVEGMRIDLFALERTVRPRADLMEPFIHSFYLLAKEVGLRPTRIDIVIVYERACLKRVIHTYADGRRKGDGYVFKEPDDKRRAVLGIVKVL